MVVKVILYFWRDYWNIAVGSGTGKLEIYYMGESLGAEGGAAIGSSNGRLYGNGDGKIDLYLIGE